MILETRAGAMAELRTPVEWGTSAIIPTWSSQSVSQSGMLVTPDLAFAISSVAQAIRQPAVLIAGLPLDVYDVSADRRQRTLAQGKWQNQLLDQPDLTRPGFDYWSDLSSHVDGYGNAYAFKIRDGARVVELPLLNPERMRCKQDPKTRARTYTYTRDTGEIVEIAGGNILHVRGWDPSGNVVARSPIERHRNGIGKLASRSRFEEKFLANDARPGVVIKMPEKVSRTQAAEFLELYNSRHQADPGKASVIGGGGDITTLPISFADLQFVEAENFAVDDISRIFDWHPSLLGRQERTRLFVDIAAWTVRIHLMPRLCRIEAAFGDDPDLFGATSKFRPYHDVSELLRGDAGTMATVFHQLVQVGVMTPNEARVPLGLPLIEGGDELQQTPVGGAANDAPAVPDTAPPATDTEAP